MFKRISAAFSMVLVAVLVITTAHASPYGQGVYGANIAYGSQTSITLSVGTSSVTTFAGSGNPTYGDGTGTNASFDNPQGLAFDSSGNLYVSDFYNDNIRKITPAGVVTTFAGSTTGGYGAVDGTGNAATFNQPTGLAIDSSNNLYVSDSGNYRIRKITPAGVVTTLAGSTQGFANGTGTAAKFGYPEGLVVDSAGNVFVADTAAYVVRKITPAGVVTTFAGTVGTAGGVNAQGTNASFNGVFGLAIDSGDNMYETDSYGAFERKISPTANVSALAGSVSGYADGTGTGAAFNGPQGVAVGGAGVSYVVDTSNNRIRQVTSGGVVTTIAGSTSGYVNSTGTNAQFSGPTFDAIDNAGNIYVADTNNNVIRKIVPGGNVSLPVTPSTGGSLVTASNSVSVYSTDIRGYKLYVNSLSSSNMVNGAANIPSSSNSTAAALAVNTWGYNLDGTTNFVGMSTTPTLLFSGTGPFENGNSTLLTYGVKVDLTKPAGQYNTTVLYTAVPQTN